MATGFDGVVSSIKAEQSELFGILFGTLQDSGFVPIGAQEPCSLSSYRQKAVSPNLVTVIAYEDAIKAAIAVNFIFF